MVKLLENDTLAYRRIAEIEKESFSSCWGAEEYQNLNENDNVKILVYEEESSGILGFVIFCDVLGDVEIYRIAVEKERRGKGIGAILMNAASEYATGNMVLEVRVTNDAAIALYKKVGLSCLGVRKKYYEDGEDAFIFGRKAK